MMTRQEAMNANLDQLTDELAAAGWDSTHQTVEEAREAVLSLIDETQGKQIVTVWYDDTSDESGYVVDVEDDNGSLTVNVFDDFEEAVAFAKQYAKQSGMRFEDRT